MSTRANIIIKDHHRQVIFYRHSDGYPEGTLPSLKKFMDWVKTKKIRDNVGQASGWLIMIGAQEYGTIYMGGGERRPKPTLIEPNKEDFMIGWKVGAYEPSTGIHSDIEYLYTLDLNAKTITVQEVIDDGQYKLIEIIGDEPTVPKGVERPSRFDGVVV